MAEKNNVANLTKQVTKLYQITEDKLSAVPSALNAKQLQILHTATPKEHIHYFPKNAGKMAGLPFVTGGYIKHMLDRLTGFMWNFEVKEKGNTGGQIWVLGRLTLLNQDGSPLMFKEQFGRASIKYKKGADGNPSNEPVDVGNDMKAATTDALKKCASELGIARDIYSANEFLEVNIVDREDLEDLKENDKSNPPEETKPQVKVDDRYKSDTTDLLNKLIPLTAERMRFLKDSIGKILLKDLTDHEWVYIREQLDIRNSSSDDTKSESGGSE